jgi:hypothetical protein
MGKAATELDPCLTLPIRQTDSAQIQTALTKKTSKRVLNLDKFFDLTLFQRTLITETNPFLDHCFSACIDNIDPLAKSYLLRIADFKQAFTYHPNDHLILREQLDQSMNNQVSEKTQNLIRQKYAGIDINRFAENLNQYAAAPGEPENAFEKYLSSFDYSERISQASLIGNVLVAMQRDHCSNDLIEGCYCGHCYQGDQYTGRVAYGLEMFQRWLEAGGKPEAFSGWKTKNYLAKELYSTLDNSVQIKMARMLLLASHNKPAGLIDRETTLKYYKLIDYDYSAAEQVFEKRIVKNNR